jgi:6-phosphogluconolactonase
MAKLTAADDQKPPASGNYWVYLGTYTNKGLSKGIYRCLFDIQSGQLSEPELAAEMTNPSFLALSPDGKTLYAVGEIAGGPKSEGGVAAYRVDPANGQLSKLSEESSGGAGPCHVSTDPTGRLLVVANYSGGSWKLIRVNTDGSLSRSHRFTQLTGSGPNKQRQEKSHAHCGEFDPSGTYFYIPDLGSDQVWVYEYRKDNPDSDPKTTEVGTIKLPPGAGPRHIHISKDGKLAYVCGELNSTVNVVRLEPESAKFTVIQSLSTLPGGQPVPGNSTAEVRIHPSGKFVYVSNRGHNSIAAFQVHPDTGELTAIGHAQSEDVKVPRNFNIDPTGQWMLVASQAGNNVAVFKIDQKTGLPAATGTKVTVGMPVCVKFLAKP